VLIELGGAAVSAGRLDDAAARYRELAGLKPNDADIRNNLGILLARTGDLRGAIAAFEAALQCDPSHAAARRNLESVRAHLPKP
jgi:Flp pilus assembly protein TadD